MEEFIIQGGIPLHGELIPSGNKNAVLPMMASSLLTSEPVVFHNVPKILDVQTMIRLL
ncbi:MAG: UDP-N-acetylglucosamine 1-carboxyvinyltransferase, partial [Chloroflexota bacterium]|nr:UDP-N-acetylglucosamine 1-carboxyvinyltransferase [Chloroflexota bacterium]